MKKVYELCPHCGEEVKLKAIFTLQRCPNCGQEIKPCSLCDMNEVDCSQCKLGGDR